MTTDVTALLRPPPECVNQMWNAAQHYYNLVPGQPVGDLNAKLEDVYERWALIGGWVVDACTGTRLPEAVDFSQAGIREPTRPEQLVEFMNTLKACVGGEIGIVIHGGLYPVVRGDPVPWNQLTEADFKAYVDAAEAGKWNVAFDATLFNHLLVKEGLSLATISSLEEEKRRFFVEHIKRMLDIANAAGKRLGKVITSNVWAIDGSRYKPVNRLARRRALLRSLAEIAEYARKLEHVKVAVEFKLTAPETEEFTVASLETVLAFVAQNSDVMSITLDLGHSWPGRDWDDLISAIVASGIGIVTHAAYGPFSDSDLVVPPTTDLIRYYRELRMCEVHESPVVVDTFDKVSLPLAAAVISINSVRAAQMLGEVHYALSGVMEEAEQEENEGLKMLIGQAADLLSPQLIVAKAAVKFGLEDPTPLIRAKWQPA